MPSPSSEPAAATPLSESAAMPRPEGVATPVAEAIATLPADVDLHARPAAQFVRLAMGFAGSRITVASAEREVDAKSLLSVLSLGAKGGTSLRLAADGDDAPDAVAALAACVAGLTE